MVIRNIFTSPDSSLAVLFVVLLYLSGWGADNSYGMALAIPENNIENLITSSGLTVNEEALFRDIINGMITNNKKTWYSEDFLKKEHLSSKDAVDLKEILKIMSLAESSMEVVKMVDARVNKIVSDKRKRLGRWGIQADIKEIPYRISSNNHNIALEIERHDCLKGDGVIVPSNETTDVPGSVWLDYTDSVYVPFKCPVIYDFDKVKALKALQEFQARPRIKREVTEEHSQVHIVQVNLTITNEVFDKSMLNIGSSNYLRLTSNLTTAIDGIFSATSEYKAVNDFSFRPGSVIASFHVEFAGSNSVATVKGMLENATISGMLGSFAVNTSLLNVGKVPNDNGMYTPWQPWSACSKSCGAGQKTRSRSCNSTAPLACAHDGPSIETEVCYLKYCSGDCSKVLTGDRGNISSPEENGMYPASAECVWQINVDVNHTVVVEFKDFDLEQDKKCKYDFLAFYDGNYQLSSLARSNEFILRFCGNGTQPRAYPFYSYPINSTGNSMTVYFKTDSTMQRKGFTAIWYKVLKLHLRVSNVVPQKVTTLSLIYNPWSTIKDAAIPMGKATTCPESFGEKDCYFYGKQTIISRIISLFLNREFEIDSTSPISITFEHILDEEIFPDAYTGRKTCVTWDHSITSPRLGAWTRRGCYLAFSNLTHTLCKCSHTGIFAALGETKIPPKDLYLKGNTYFGVAVSLLFVILIVYSLAAKGNINTGELFHLFETLVTGVLLVIFITGAHVPAEKELCGFLAFVLYYFVLSQFTWMLLTVFWIQNLLKRIVTERVKINIVYMVLGWGVPLILAGVAGKVDIDQRGNKDNVCWVSLTGTGTVWGYGAPIFVMLMMNVAIFIFLLMPKAKQNYDTEKMRPRILKEVLVMFFFIMTWVLGVKVILDDSFKNQYFFCFFLILQGVVNYNVCFEPTEQFWKEHEVKEENLPEEDESVEQSQEAELEENKDENKMEQPRMTVKTLKNLNIYKENGVFVIEA